MTQTLVGIQGELGSFHEQAANEFYASRLDDIQYVSHPTHEALLHDLFSSGSELHQAVVAVDNNTSGRVISAINALGGQPNVQIIGSLTIPVEQYLLMVPGQRAEDLEAVLSQKPALDQCRSKIDKAGLVALEYHDTAAAAGRIGQFGGSYQEYDHVAAIGSRDAAELHGLVVGPRFSEDNNATKFWIVSDELGDTVDTSSTHSALTFEVSDHAGQLFRAIGILSVEHGLNLTDIDSHLAPHSENGRAFFAELEHGDIEQLASAVQSLQVEGFMPKVLGHYSPVSTLEVQDGSLHVPGALKHDEWNGRKGLVYPDNASIIYVETNHQTGALYQALGHLAGCNLLDLGRPIVPKDHRLNRGFYIVIDPATPLRVRDAAIHALKSEQFKVDVVEYDEEVV